MKIQSLNSFNYQNRTKSPNFRAIPLYDVTLLDKLGEKGIKATVVELEKNNAKDIFAIDEVAKQCDRKNSWLTQKPDWIFFSILDHFKRPNEIRKTKYYAVTVPDKDNFKILGCMSLNENSRTEGKLLWLNDLFVSNDVAKRNESRNLRGVGEVLLGEAIRLAKNSKNFALDFISVADKFYDHSFNNAKIGNARLRDTSAEYRVEQSKFDKFLEYCDKKYSATIQK